MCGLSGTVHCGTQGGGAELFDAITRMTRALYHRGPDDHGVWIDRKDGIALGHRRLAIIDLSDKGKQPMQSACGRYVMVYNGELYNFRSIRKDLEKGGVSIDGSSDTAVLLSAIAHWGLRTAIDRSHGMFAFALWDKVDKRLSLVRDRLGEKPLYYGYSGETFLFGSELKALASYPDWRSELDRDVLTLQLRHGYIPGPYSIYKGIYKLPPGSVLDLHVSDIRQKKEIRATAWMEENHSLGPVRYWSVRQAVESAASNNISYSYNEALEHLDELLRRTIRNQMISDVPLGAFLSGGVDSSLVVALMQAQSTVPVKTFTIGFHETRFNEAEYAKQVAKVLGSDHTELYLTTKEAMDVIPELPSYYDEPFSDPSQIPTYLVSRLAREQVTVTLSGDGGDELFAGYDRYFWARSIWGSIERLPISVRNMLAKTLHAVPIQVWDRVFTGIRYFLPSRFKLQQPAEKLNKLGDLLEQKDFVTMYRRLISNWAEPERLVLGATEPATVLTNREQWPTLSDQLRMMQYLDMLSYLPDDILVKLDRASMSVSLESRVPLLDHDVVEFALRLPRDSIVVGDSGKRLLKSLLSKYVPRELVERPKMGFGVPIGEWLRGEMRAWAEDLLDPASLERDCIFDPVLVRNKWIEHKEGRRNWEYELWNILMFQSWYQQQKWTREAPLHYDYCQ